MRQSIATFTLLLASTACAQDVVSFFFPGGYDGVDPVATINVANPSTTEFHIACPTGVKTMDCGWGPGLDVTILKAGMIYGRGDHLVDHLSRIVQTIPVFASVGLRERSISPIPVEELVDVLVAATPMALQRAGHPAKRVFQALRIEVNGELASLEAAVPAALDRIGDAGRIVVLAYQSLEDRFVKRELAARTTSTAPQGLPVELPEHRPEFRLLVRGAELASADEIDLNPRAKPVRLRAAERIRRTS